MALPTIAVAVGTEMKMSSLMAGAALALAASFAAVSAQATEFVTNGSFETGNFSGWTLSGDTGYTGVQSGCFDSGCPTDGTELAYFGQVSGSGVLSQVLATATGLYNLSFDLSNDSGSFFSAVLGGATLLSNPPSEATTHYSFTNIGLTGPSTLSFTFFNPPAYYTLDNVSVTSAVAGVPEPASWALMLTGFLGLGGALRSARRRVAVAA